MYQSLPSQIVIGMMLVVCTITLLVGGSLHRLVAVLIAGNWLLSGLVQNRQDWISPQWGILGLDLLLAIITTALALRSGGWWLLTHVAFTWLQVMTHLVMLYDDQILARAYLTALGLWSLAQLLSLAYGTWTHWSSRYDEQTVTSGEPPS